MSENLTTRQIEVLRLLRNDKMQWATPKQVAGDNPVLSQNIEEQLSGLMDAGMACRKPRTYPGSKVTRIRAFVYGLTDQGHAWLNSNPK